jgi:hypothetical protein
MKYQNGRLVILRHWCFLAIVMCVFIALSPEQARVQCIPEDGPDCPCYIADCEPVGCEWPFAGFLGNLVGTTELTVGTRSCCFRHCGQAYWQIQRQVSIPWACEAIASEDPLIQARRATRPQAWCTETVAFWGREACVPYARGYYAEGLDDEVGHHRSSYVKGGGEMRRWYEAEEIRPGISRGRWICATELDYENFEPGVNGPCPCAYQQIYSWDPADPDGNGNWWDDPTGHSQVIDSMVIYRLHTVDGSIQGIDVKMVEGNIGFGGGSIYARIINTRWYRNIIDFTPLGPDFLDARNKKIRGWGINLDSDGTVCCDSSRIENVIIHYIRGYPAPGDPEDTDSAYVAAMVNYFTVTGGTLSVTTNSPMVQTGGALPHETNPWTIPPPPHPEDPVYIEVDLLAEYPDRVEAITLEWLQEIPREFTVMWAGDDATFQSRAVTLPTPPPTVPSGTVLPLTVMFTPDAPDTTGHSIQYVRLCIPQSALTKTFQIQRFHYDYFCDEIEDGNESSPEGDAGDPWVGIEEGHTPPMDLWLRSAYPNPFQTGTSVAFGIPKAGSVRLTIYDVQGRRIKVMLHRFFERGPHTVLWDGRNEIGSICPSGVYFVRLEWRGRVHTQKLVLMR